MLVSHFLEKSRFNQLSGGELRVREIADDAMDAMMAHQWPGNVRELVNAVERAVSFADGGRIEAADLPEHISGLQSFPINWGATVTDGAAMSSGRDTPGSPSNGSPAVVGTFKTAKEQWVSSFEKDYIEELLRRNGGNISHAAREAEIDRKYFRKLMKKYQIET